jgi:hypothetical protein
VVEVEVEGDRAIMVAADGRRFPVTLYPGLKPMIISAREAARHYGMEYGSDEEAKPSCPGASMRRGPRDRVRARHREGGQGYHPLATGVRECSRAAKGPETEPGRGDRARSAPVR